MMRCPCGAMMDDFLAAIDLWYCGACRQWRELTTGGGEEDGQTHRHQPALHPEDHLPHAVGGALLGEANQ